MKTEKIYCAICCKVCEFQILIAEDYADLRGSSHAILRESSRALLWGSSHAILKESSHADLWGSSHAILRESSHADLWESSRAILWESSRAVGHSSYATMIIKSPNAVAQGGNIMGNQVIPAREWLDKCGVEIKREFVILFKSINKDFTTSNGVIFKPKTYHKAPDWDVNFDGECGKGIHYSPTVTQARIFREEGVYVACRVKISDIANLPAFAQYPDKIRAKGGFTLYQVDENGNKLEAKHD